MSKEKDFHKTCTSTKEVLHDLQGQLNMILNSYKKDYQIEIAVKDRDDSINLVEAFPIEFCINTSLDILKILRRFGVLDKEAKGSAAIKPIQVAGPEVIKLEIELWDFLQYRVKELCNRYSSDIVAICYWVLFIIVARRLLLYFNPIAKDSFYLHSADMLEQDRLSKTFLDRSYKNLIDCIKNQATKEIEEEDIPLFLVQSLRKAFWDTDKDAPLGLEESLIKAARGDIEEI